jgi:hypothetical protein
MDPAGSLSLAQEALRVTVADCPTFRTLAGASDRTSALAKLYHEGLPEPKNGTAFTREELTAYRPYGILYTDDRNGFKRQRGSASSFVSGGRLKLRLYRTCPALVDDEPTSDANLEWKNILGTLMSEMCDLAVSESPDYLAFEVISLDYGPYWSRPELVPTQGCWQGAEIGIGWSGQ